MPAGVLTIIEDGGDEGTQFLFVLVNFPDGWPADTIQRVGEPITATGVDGTRARNTRDDYPVFQMMTTSEYQTFDLAVQAVGLMRGGKIKRCTLQVTAAGVEYNFIPKAYIWDVKAKPIRADSVSSDGILTDPQGLVHAEWTLQFILEPTE